MWTFVAIVVPPISYNKENAYLLITMIYLTKTDEKNLICNRCKCIEYLEEIDLLLSL